MTDTTNEDPGRLDRLRNELSAWADGLKADLEALDIADELRGEITRRIDQRVDELGAKIGAI